MRVKRTFWIVSLNFRLSHSFEGVTPKITGTKGEVLFGFSPGLWVVAILLKATHLLKKVERTTKPFQIIV
jgi:hypothetical protein